MMTQRTTLTVDTPAARNTITMPQFLRLCDWLRATTLTDFATRAALVDAAAKGIGIPLTVCNLRKALKACGLHYREPRQAPKALPGRRSATLAELRTVARAVADIASALGISVGGDLIQIVNGGE